MEATEKTKKNNFPRRFWLTLIIIFLAIPAVIFFFNRMGTRTYYLSSILVVILVMVPFFLVFEYRKPQARELVVLAVLCALAVASRAVFYAIPFFKPMTGIIIISAISFGPEAGFLVGAMSGFVSNFLFGQGPWTPFQMFAYGMAGFLTGVLSYAHLLPRKRLPLGIYGFLLVLVIVGPLLDVCAMLTATETLTPAFAGAILLSGLPVNAIHGVATFLILFFFERPLTEKLDRIKLKYGMMEGADDAV